MGKKLCTNPKAQEARERAQQKKIEEAEQLSQTIEDQKWVDMDKKIINMQNRKTKKEEKRLNDLARKEANKIKAQEEMDSLKSTKSTQQVSRLTQKEITDNIARIGPDGYSNSSKLESNNNSPKRSLSKSFQNGSEDDDIILPDVPQNLNRMQSDIIHASGIDQAVNLLESINIGEQATKIDRYPEKRRKALFQEYRQKEMLRLKVEEPTLTYSQKEQIIFKNWQKHPNNPVFASRFG